MRTSGKSHERAAAERAAGSDGFTLIELVVAISLLAIVAGGFVASLGLGFRTIALARQRQTAASIAEARLEHLRSIPYTQVALPSALTQSTDPTNPDSGLSADGTAFDIDGHGTMEPRPRRRRRRRCAHRGPLSVVGTTTMDVYDYVTWVDDPGIAGTQDYRRVTVVVVYKTPTLNGVSKFVPRVRDLLVGNGVGGRDDDDRAWTDDDRDHHDHGGTHDHHRATERVPERPRRADRERDDQRHCRRRKPASPRLRTSPSI